MSGELERAPATARDLLETIVGRLDPPFRLAKEGDAAFLWVEDGRADGWLLMDAVEASIWPSGGDSGASIRLRAR